MLYNPPTGSTDPDAHYVPKNVAAGTQGSKVPPAAVENPQREIVGAITASGQTPTNSDLGQLWKAILAGARSVIGGSKIVGGRRAIYNAAGTYTLQLPSGVTSFDAEIWGAGGGGGGANSSTAAASGGGGGDYEVGTYSCPDGSVLTIVVGASGAGGAAGGGTGGNGGLSSIAVNGTVIATALGGSGAAGSTNGGNNSGAAGGTGTGGQDSRPGGSGGFPYAISDGSTSRLIGGTGGSAFSASTPPPNLAGAGNPGSSPGGGGNGSSTNAAGGAGGIGKAIIRY